jgi:small subunit ribosomal protein S6
MRAYELALITASGIDEEQREGIISRIKTLVLDSGGTIVDEAMWGRRVLAYPVRHQLDAYYSFLRFRAEPATVDELDRVLSIADEVLRFKVIRLPEDVASGKVPLVKSPTR